MKSKKFDQKLVLKKLTIANLRETQMHKIQGGIATTTHVTCCTCASCETCITRGISEFICCCL